MTSPSPRVLSYGRQCLDEDDIQAVLAVMRGDYLTQGPAVARFEAAIAAYVGAKHAVAVNSGTAALHIGCLAAGMEPGGRGLTSTLTFVASANCILYCGGRADLVDVDPETLCLSTQAVARQLAAAPETAVLVPVHFGGLAAGMPELRQLAGKRTIIEDASHALGGTYEDGRRVGCCAYSDMTVFSFHPVKPITTGEGGVVTTNDDELAHRLRLLRSHGIERNPDAFVDCDAIEEGMPHPWHYEQQMLGFNYRITDIQAALGETQLAKLDRFIERRRAIAAFYDDAFADLAFARPVQRDPALRARSAHHLYILAFDFDRLGLTRHQVMKLLAAERIMTQVHYIPVHRQPFHQAQGHWKRADFPVAERHFAQCLSLPLHPSLSSDDLARVVAAVRALERAG